MATLASLKLLQWYQVTYTLTISSQVRQTGLYMHTADLLCLGWARPTHITTLPEKLSLIQTPLVSQARETALAEHPDRAFTMYILEGLHQGFRIGFQHHFPLRSATSTAIYHGRAFHRLPPIGSFQQGQPDHPDKSENPPEKVQV